MNNLIEKVAELRKLEGRRQAIAARQHEMGTPNHSLRERLELEHEMRNAAPRLLDVLSKIQAGDAKRLAGLIRWQTINDECSQDEIDMLDRLHEMACKMEANHE